MKHNYRDEHYHDNDSRLRYGDASNEQYAERSGSASGNVGMFHIERWVDICAQGFDSDTTHHGNYGSQRRKLAELHRSSIYEKSFRNLETNDRCG